MYKLLCYLIDDQVPLFVGQLLEEQRRICDVRALLVLRAQRAAKARFQFDMYARLGKEAEKTARGVFVKEPKRHLHACDDGRGDAAPEPGCWDGCDEGEDVVALYVVDSADDHLALLPHFLAHWIGE